MSEIVKPLSEYDGCSTCELPPDPPVCIQVGTSKHKVDKRKTMLSRRKFITGSSMALAATVAFGLTHRPMTEAEALVEARRRWADLAVIENQKGKTYLDNNGAYYMVGWKGDFKGNSAMWWGDTWEDAFHNADHPAGMLTPVYKEPFKEVSSAR